MVALCPNHHQEIGKQSKKVAYSVKANPINIRSKRFKGYLVTNKENQAIILGNTRFVGFSTAVSYFGIPLFGHSISDGEIRVNCFVPDQEFFPEVEIINNDVTAIVDGFWDIDFKSNYVRFRRKKRDIFLELDFRKDDVEVRGRFVIQGATFEFSPTKSDFGGPRIENMTLQGFPGGTAISHGRQGERLLRPNFAMRVPRAQMIGVR